MTTATAVPAEQVRSTSGGHLLTDEPGTDCPHCGSRGRRLPIYGTTSCDRTAGHLYCRCQQGRAVKLLDELVVRYDQPTLRRTAAGIAAIPQIDSDPGLPPTRSNADWDASVLDGTWTHIEDRQCAPVDEAGSAPSRQNLTENLAAVAGDRAPAHT